MVEGVWGAVEKIYRSLTKKGPVSNICPLPLLLQFPAKVYTRTVPVNSNRHRQSKTSRLPAVLGGCVGVQYPVVGCDNVNMGAFSW